ncbi:FG-GAP-like repeat-containing protein [uncultured Aquimarina sp.]|uniref:right-handed parallel beta-helix repeat-containing protein n=1 Tax=uncultured Aquimarina sp. TaxID=575652 RepID=UPI0026153FEC|nr:FG-GAP-like repeat-containing protein [uncultured Aquimarina sp.]
MKKVFKLTVIIVIFCQVISCETNGYLENEKLLISEKKNKNCISESESTIIIENEIDFINHLQNPEQLIPENSIILIKNDISINSDNLPIELPKGVIISGDSCIEEDNIPKLKFSNTQNPEEIIVFKIIDDNVTIQNLKIEGPYSDPPIKCATDEPVLDYFRVGIEVLNSDNFTLNNSEIVGWNNAGIRLNKAKNSRITNNSIHHNEAENLGYGVVLTNGSSTIIEGNKFDRNRHHIAGTGNSDGEGNYDSYEVRNNEFVMENAIAHGIDMHAGGNNDPETIAGGEIYIHHNTFKGNASESGCSTQPGIRVRGIPNDFCLIEHNNFLDYPLEEKAIRQVHNFGNFYASNNHYGSENKGFYVSWRGMEPWYRIGTDANLGFDNMFLGKFSDNGESSILYNDDSKWKMYEFRNSSGTSRRKSNPEILSSSQIPFEDLSIGDFNGDGMTDVFRSNGINWFIAYSANVSNPFEWNSLNVSSGYTKNNLKFGDFDGNGTTDLLKANGTNFSVAYSGDVSKPFQWEIIANSGAMLDDVKIGDFNGDGISDILRTTGEIIYIAFGNTSGDLLEWESIVNSDITMDSIHGLGDFNGDGKTDLLRLEEGQFFIAYSDNTSNPWVFVPKIKANTNSVVQFGINDFNGDNVDDIMIIGKQTVKN